MSGRVRGRVFEHGGEGAVQACEAQLIIEEREAHGRGVEQRVCDQRRWGALALSHYESWRGWGRAEASEVV